MFLFTIVNNMMETEQGLVLADGAMWPRSVSAAAAKDAQFHQLQPPAAPSKRSSPPITWLPLFPFSCPPYSSLLLSRRLLPHSSWPLALPSIRSQLSHSSSIASRPPLYPRRSLPHSSSLLAPHPLPALVHLTHFRSPSPFIAAAAPFIATIPHSSIPYSSSSVFAHRPLIHSPPPPLVV